VSFEDMTDRTALTTREYASPDRLGARIALYAYRQPPLELADVAARLLHGVPGPVLDVGCGPGRYLAALRADRPDRPVFGADLSMGMAVATGAPAMVADAAALPVASGSCGAVLAMHMLYHVPDVDRALAELARVRRPDGVLLVATNGLRDKELLRALHNEVVRELTGAVVDRNISARFSLEDGEAAVRRHFTRVERLDFHAQVAVPDPGPVVAWLGSMSGPDITPEVLDAVGDRVAEVIAREGSFRFGTHAGFLLCR
jgi:SAM-dependent methyltransferase